MSFNPKAFPEATSSASSREKLMYLQAYRSRVRARMFSSVGRMHMTHLGREKSSSTTKQRCCVLTYLSILVKRAERCGCMNEPGSGLSRSLFPETRPRIHLSGKRVNQELRRNHPRIIARVESFSLRWLRSWREFALLHQRGIRILAVRPRTNEAGFNARNACRTN